MSLSKKAKNILLFLFRIGLSGALLTYLFYKMDIGKMADVLIKADYQYIAYAAATFIVITFLLLLRWVIFIRALDLVVPFRSVFNYFFIGLFFNLFLPTSTGGDIVKTIGIFRDTDQKAKVVATVVCDRLSGFIAISIVAAVAFLFGFKLINDNSILLSIIVLAALSSTAVLFLFNETLYSFCCRVFNRFPHIKEKFMRLHYAIALLKGRIRFMFLAIGLSCLSQVIFAFTFYLVAKALQQDISIVYFLIFVPIICVVSSLPSIGGLGVRDAGAAYYFAKVGVATSTAVSMTLINFLFMVAVGLVGGVLYVVALTPSQREDYEDETAVELDEV